jgi:DNA polymerase-3 subunit delta
VPALAVDTLRSHTKSRKFAPVYLLFGDDTRLMEQLVDAIEATVAPGDRPFAVERLFAGEQGGSPVDVAAAANVFPMLGDRRVVILLRAERLLKPKRASKQEDAEPAEAEEAVDGDGGMFDTVPLEAYLDNPSPSTVLVIVAADIDRGRRFTKRLLEKAACVEFGGLVGDNAAEQRQINRDAVTQLQREFAAAGRQVDAATATALVEAAGGDISKLRDDVERLVLFTEGRKVVSRADIEIVVSPDAQIDDWAVVNAIGDGDLPRALSQVALRMERGDSPHQLVGQLRWWVSTRLAPASPDRVKPALDALLRADLALKSSGDTRALVERLVIELTGKPVAKPAWMR